MTSPFGSIASSGSKSSSTSSKSASSKSASSTNPSQQSPSEEDSADDYYAHISHREEVEEPITKEKPKPQKKPAVVAKQEEEQSKEQVTNPSERSSNASDSNGIIDIGTEIGTEIETTVPKEKTKPKPKPKPKNAPPRKQEEITYPSELSRNVSGETKRISWNSDPNASFSDWKVEVLVRETQQRQLFYLHRNIVGFGPRKSEFLKEAFAQEQQDGKENMTKLILPEYQAKVFPMVMDYIYYTREARQSLTASRACAMYNIAERLEIVSLEKAIMEFYRKNTSLENVSEFFKCAKEADAVRLIAVSKAKIGTMIIQKPELGKLVPPSFLIEIIEIYREEFEDIRKKNPRSSLSNADLVQSKRLSKAAYLCVSHSKSTMNENLLNQLTNEKALPVIDVAVALPFLNLTAKFDKGSSEYTSLQRRCVKSITDNWSTFQKQFSSSEKVSNALKKLPSHVLADILVMTMNR